jgi:hypothetical protein
LQEAIEREQDVTASARGGCSTQHPPPIHRSAGRTGKASGMPDCRLARMASVDPQIIRMISCPSYERMVKKGGVGGAIGRR